MRPSRWGWRNTARAFSVWGHSRPLAAANEEHEPEAAEALQRLAEAHAQQDPTFRTTLAYTRLTSKAALEALRAQGVTEDHLPSPSTMAEVLNRMGYRLRKVLKAKPQKKITETDAIFANRKKRPPRRRREAGQTLEHGL